MSAFLEIIDLMGERQSLKVESDGWTPLTVERIGTGHTGRPAYSFCHYGEQAGDLMRDPELCFEVFTMPDGTRRAFAYFFRNDYAGSQRTGQLIVTPTGSVIGDRAAQDMAQFAVIWSQNLHEQGFVESAKRATEPATTG